MWVSLGWTKKNWLKVSITLLVLIVGAFGVKHFIFKKPFVASNSSLGNHIQNLQTKAAQQELDQKNYSQAAESYISAASGAIASSNYAEAKNIMQEGVAKVPDSYIPWYYYDQLSAIASHLNDKQLQLTCIEKALAKAQEPASGAPSELTTTYQKMINQLKAENE